jgi:hypothetical protein
MQYTIGLTAAEFITNTLSWVNGGDVDISGSTYTANT